MKQCQPVCLTLSVFYFIFIINSETVLHPVDPLRPPDYVPLSTSSEDIPKQVPSTEKMLAKPTVMTGKDNIREVLISGVAFSMVFTGYFIVTSFQTSVNASLGAIALAVLFLSFSALRI